jgi:tripartite-type tricarboxylate transporter receptor subunit TctC
MIRKSIAAVVTLICFANTSHAQTYPDRPVHILVGFAAGSGPDVLARAVAAQLGADLGQNFIVENRTGANGTIATNVVAQSAPDGYTLLSTSDSIAPTPFIYKQLPYDVFKDITPIGTIGVLDGLLMLVNPSSPAHNVDEFIAYAKTHRVLYGSPGIGNGLHLAAALFNKTVGLNMEHVPFKGASEVSAALLGGNIDVMFVTPPSVIGLVKDGKLRAIAFTGSKPFPELPDVPLMKTSVPNYPPIESWNMFFAPTKTPLAIIDKLNAAIRHALNEPAVVNVVQKSGFMPDNRTPEQSAAYFRIKVETAKKAVEAAGIEPN